MADEVDRPRPDRYPFLLQIEAQMMVTNGFTNAYSSTVFDRRNVRSRLRVDAMLDPARTRIAVDGKEINPSDILRITLMMEFNPNTQLPFREQHSLPPAGLPPPKLEE